MAVKTKKAQPTAAQSSFLPPENIWFLLRKTKEKERWMRSNFPKSSFLVPEEGLEPSRIAPRDFESRAYTNSATPAYLSNSDNIVDYTTYMI